ncbi:palmitoyltransferase Pfa5p [[Candida] jaroonii]|uniref:Palmitoyltransferase Pfa5p n=1 Tax=[Candida] jaroonii TaxID=467808 RepID=A0ACA9YBU4_9ASCO|nr:palmitoyltransferase Pfa5p [[Candida] jaroonii]
MTSLPTSKNPIIRLVTPILVILGLGYLDFVAYYSLGYQEIYRYHGKGIAISLWVLISIFQVLTFIYWGAIILAGPGRYPRENPYDLYGTGEGGPVPDYFICDDSGFPIWCSNCQSIKIPRSKHLSRSNRCVPKADHFCLWVGDSLGQNNYRFFLKYLLWFDSYFITILCYLAVYTPSNYQRGEINHNFIVLYVQCGFWILMISLLIGSNILYLMYNMTTIDDLAEKAAKRKNRSKNSESHVDNNVFLNVKHENLRLVIQCSVFDRLYNFGFKHNFINVFLYDNTTQLYSEDKYTTQKFILSIAICFIPFLDIFFRRPKNDNFYPALSPKFQQHIEEKINNKRCYLPSYVSQKEPRE